MIETTPLVRKLGAFVALSSAELAVLASLHKRRRTFVAGRDLVHQGQSDKAAYILASGWACSYKLLEDGQRQVRISRKLGSDFARSRARISRHRGQPFHALGQAGQQVS